MDFIGRFAKIHLSVPACKEMCTCKHAKHMNACINTHKLCRICMQTHPPRKVCPHTDARPRVHTWWYLPVHTHRRTNTRVRNKYPQGNAYTDTWARADVSSTYETGHAGPLTCAHRNRSTGRALRCSEVSSLPYRGCDGRTHVLSDYQSVVVCEAQTPISGAFESISSLEGKQKRLELA